MPCACWYEPGEEPKKLIKSHCKEIVDEIKRLESVGDPIGISLDCVKELLEHMYTGKCEEKDNHA